ncbi:MFS transporter [Streptomyces spiroverticillatus]|uniref:MFS transporter n=1 Tax=Streptomyces finlayi TaxID=67296 RepID=A0A918X295_9ACTN|nr:MFS transporter [Streptomyces finlayi]GHA23540.1 MFS transporter [Streptomyces spiroverticillatus]GHD04840.1 MFS transporter [Streptomyces finlayi]
MPRTVWLLVTARAINRLGAFSLPFLTVLISTEFGASTATAGALSAAFGLATIPSRLAGGRLSARIGRRHTIVLGLTGCGLAQLGIAAAGSLFAVAVFAVLLGLAFELYEPPSQALIADAVAPAERVRAYSLLNAALAIGGTGAGLIAAGLGRWDLRWLFVADALTCLACALVLHFALPADRRSPTSPTTQATSVHPWRDPALWAMFLPGTAFALVAMQVIMALPLTLERRGFQPADAGLMFTTSALTIVAAQPALRLRRLAALDNSRALALGYVVMACGLAWYAVARDLPSFVLATVLWGLGDALVMGRVFGVVAGIAPAYGTDRYLAAYGISWGIATVAAPVVATQLLVHAGVTLAWAAPAVLCAALATVQLLVVRPLIAQKEETDEPPQEEEASRDGSSHQQNPRPQNPRGIRS